MKPEKNCFFEFQTDEDCQSCFCEAKLVFEIIEILWKFHSKTLKKC
jgi:hypothetical protein